MRYRAVRPLPLLLGIVICCLGLGCSNSEFTESAGWEEYANSAYVTEGDSPSGKQSCFDNFRLPNLQSATCQEQFYTQDTITDFPESGFFQKTFTIAFPDNKLLNCEIGGKPVTKESPLLSAIQVDSSMTIRCADFSEKIANTEIIRTYILEKNPDIAAVFLTTDPNALFDPDTGIYMEGPNAEEATPHYGANYWLDKEIPIFVELIENDQNTPAFAKHAGLEIFGNYSRMKDKKSVAITFRKKYGDNRLSYKLFPDFPDLNTFRGFILRNNGTNFNRDYIRDRLASSLGEGLGVDYQRGRFTVVYYNGKYFGIHDLRERSNEYYFETHYGISHKSINLLKADNSVSAGSADDYIALMDWLKNHNLKYDSNYTYLSTKIDIDNYINYMQIEIFANNRDWPANNLKKWKTKDINSKWKWFLYDLDWGFGGVSKESPINIFEFTTTKNGQDWPNGPEHTLLFRSLLKNDYFYSSFINRMVTLLYTNLESSRIQKRINEIMSEIEPEIKRDQKRWNQNTLEMDRHLRIIQNFANERQEDIYDELQSFFNLGMRQPVKISVIGNGNISIHGLTLNNLPSTIDFFENLPVTISAIPQTGSTWHSWSDGDKNAIRTIYPGKDTELIAIFK